jgi:ketosteroid isomerase-like protein
LLKTIGIKLTRIIAAYHENWNNHNAAGITSLYTKDAFLVTCSPTQMVKNGTQEIEQNYQRLFAVVPIMIRQQPTRLYRLEPT